MSPISEAARRANQEKRVNLALGGGGAKGFVHLGVIQELVVRGIRIEAIVGTSIGAIIGSLFAHYSGHLFKESENPQKTAIEQLIPLMVKMDFWRYADLNPLSMIRRGPFKGKKIGKWLLDVLQDQDAVRPIRFGDLDFDLTVSVTDAHTGESFRIHRANEPDLFVGDAVRASMSIQGIFREIQIEVGGKPRTCWDGGTTGNCRFDTAVQTYPERVTIASSLTYRGNVVSTATGILGAPLRPFRVLNHTTSIMMRSVEEALKAAMPAEQLRSIAFVEPSLSCGQKIVGTMDFHIGEEDRLALVDNGRRAVRKALDG